MGNKKSILAALITLLTAFFVCGPVLAGPAEEEKLRKFFEGYDIPPAEVGESARVATNDELLLLTQEGYFRQVSEERGKPFNPLAYTEYLSLAYGDEHGTVDNNPEFPWAKHRYIGYTNKDEAFVNFWFRPDFVPGGGFHIHKARWIKDPRKDPLITQFLTQFGEPGLTDNPFLPDNPLVGSKLRPYIVGGLKALAVAWPPWYKFDAESSPIQDWENYVHILQPPSHWCFGTGRMFHQARDGSIWYLDVPLFAGGFLGLDLKAQLEKDEYEANPGDKIDTTATFSLDPEYDFPVHAKLKVYIETENDIIDVPFTPADPGKNIIDGKYTFQPGESLQVKFSFTAPAEAAEIVVSNHVDVWALRGRTLPESDTDNNEDRAPIAPIGQYDIKAEIWPASPNFVSINGEQTMATFKVKVTRKDNTPGVLPARVAVSLPQGVGDPRFRPVLEPGKSWEYTFSIPVRPGTLRAEINAWPDGFPDALPQDNEASATADVIVREFSPDSRIRVDIIDR